MKKTIFSLIVSTFLLSFTGTAFGQIEVSVYSQPDSPLQISSVVPKWRVLNDDQGQEFNLLEVEYMIQNRGDKAIRAYTIRQFSGEFNQDVGLTQFSFLSASASFFKPGEVLNEDIGGEGYLKKPPTVKLAVDFVEFADGNIWGRDLSKSAERAAGTKAGFAARLAYLNKINKQNGIEDVVKALDETEAVMPPTEKSDLWKKGFKSGAGNVNYIVKETYEKRGKQDAENKLQTLTETFSSN